MDGACEQGGYCLYKLIGLSMTWHTLSVSTFTFTYPLTAGVVGAPQMTSRPVSSIFLSSPLPSGTWRTPGLSIPWCCLSTSFVHLSWPLPPFTVPCKMVLARPDEWEICPYHFSLRLSCKGVSEGYVVCITITDVALMLRRTCLSLMLARSAPNPQPRPLRSSLPPPPLHPRPPSSPHRIKSSFPHIRLISQPGVLFEKLRLPPPPPPRHPQVWLFRYTI